MVVKSGEICDIEEVICQKQLHSASVRLTGRLISYDAAASHAVLEYNGFSININTLLLGKFDYRIGQLFQFIGETYRDQSQVILRARVGRNVEGLDMHLFTESLKIRREFLARNF